MTAEDQTDKAKHIFPLSTAQQHALLTYGYIPGAPKDISSTVEKPHNEPDSSTLDARIQELEQKAA